ncbi:unnamed protein product [Closterium sp. Naga37s-1]|nr:unnamed protein product [Closterium sp. Naga37s-1]
MLVACLIAAAAGSARAASALAVNGGAVVDGYVRLDALKIKSTALKILINGGDSVAFVRSNGYFSIALAPGSHTLQVAAPGAFFLPVTLQVSAKHAGNFRAMVIREQGPASLSIDPLIISPFAAEEYFERREPFSIWTIVKSPMGIMICFVLHSPPAFPVPLATMLPACLTTMLSEAPAVQHMDDSEEPHGHHDMLHACRHGRPASPCRLHRPRGDEADARADAAAAGAVTFRPLEW